MILATISFSFWNYFNHFATSENTNLVLIRLRLGDGLAIVRIPLGWAVGEALALAILHHVHSLPAICYILIFFLFHQPSQLQFSTMFTPFEHFGDLFTSFRHIWYSSLGYFLLNTLVFHHPPLEYCSHVGHYEALAITTTHLSKIQEGVVLVVGKDKYWSGCWQRQRQSKYRDSWRPTHLADKRTK